MSAKGMILQLCKAQKHFGEQTNV